MICWRRMANISCRPRTVWRRCNFFFQAEDGIRYRTVTGVQTCALPISAEHPRVFIWGLLEARLQAVDVVVLGGLVEGVWPPATEPGPWLSRPMRERAGLPSPEERVGQATHDFSSVACAAPLAVLSCPRRRDGA